MKNLAIWAKRKRTEGRDPERTRYALQTQLERWEGRQRKHPSPHRAMLIERHLQKLKLCETPFFNAPNVTEADFEFRARNAGWDVLRAGWPDFLIEKDGKVCAVEVKPEFGDTELRKSQEKMLKVMSRFMPVYKWTPKGFTKLFGS